MPDPVIRVFAEVGDVGSSGQNHTDAERPHDDLPRSHRTAAPPWTARAARDSVDTDPQPVIEPTGSTFEVDAACPIDESGLLPCWIG